MLPIPNRLECQAQQGFSPNIDYQDQIPQQNTQPWVFTNGTI